MPCTSSILPPQPLTTTTFMPVADELIQIMSAGDEHVLRPAPISSRRAVTDHERGGVPQLIPYICGQSRRARTARGDQRASVDED